jgi:hypothetical protein
MHVFASDVRASCLDSKGQVSHVPGCKEGTFAWEYTYMPVAGNEQSGIFPFMHPGVKEA